MLVLWLIGISAVMLAAVSAAAYRQAAAGREALARVRAQWAARAGVEAAMARIEETTLQPDATNAYAVFDELEDAATGRTESGEYRVSYTSPTGEVMGGADANAKLNVNVLTAESLMLLPNMTEDIADAILDWVDEDEDPRPLGAEASFYSATRYPFEPRNAPFRSIAELELIPNVTPDLVRGEDWNLNGRLDPNEDDGDASWPPDNADGKLDAGWSGILTASSVDGGYSSTGQQRLDLTQASAEEVAQRVGVDSTQAEAILTYAQSQDATLSGFIRSDLSRLAPSDGSTIPPSPLSRDQLARLLDEAQIGDASRPTPGKLNVNTCQAETLQYLPDIDPAMADAIVLERESRPSGFTSVADLLDVAGMTRNRLSRISGVLDVRSNVFVVSSRGRDAATGIEVELVATIDRTRIPAVITELRAP